MEGINFRNIEEKEKMNNMQLAYITKPVPLSYYL